MHSESRRIKAVPMWSSAAMARAMCALELLETPLTLLIIGWPDAELARVMTARGSVVSALVEDEAAAGEARVFCSTVEAASAIDTWATGSGARRFDAIVFDAAAVYVMPERIIRVARDLLAPGGHLIAVIPNIAHAARRAAALSGYLDDADFQKEYARAFTLRGAVSLMDSAGYSIERLERLRQPAATGSRGNPQSEADVAYFAFRARASAPVPAQALAPAVFDAAPGIEPQSALNDDRDALLRAELEKNEITESLSHAKGALAREEAASAELRARLEQLESASAASIASLQSRIAERSQIEGELERRIESYAAEVQRRDADYASQLAEGTRLANALAASDSLASDLRAQIADLQANLSDRDEIVNELRVALREKELAESEIQGNLRTARASLDHAEAERAALAGKLLQTEGALFGGEAIRNDLRARLEQLQSESLAEKIEWESQIASLRGDLSEESRVTVGLRARITDLAAQAESLELEVSVAQRQAAEAAAELAASVANSQGIALALDESRRRESDLRAELDLRSAMLTQAEAGMRDLRHELSLGRTELKKLRRSKHYAIARLNAELAKAFRVQDNVANKYQAAEQAIREAEAQIVRQQATIEELRALQQDWTLRLSSLALESAELKAQRDAVVADSERISRRSARIRSKLLHKIALLRRQVTRSAVSERERVEAQYTLEIQNLRSRFDDRIAGHEETISELSSKYAEAEHCVVILTAQVEHLSAERDALSAELASSQVDIIAIQSQAEATLAALTARHEEREANLKESLEDLECQLRAVADKARTEMQYLEVEADELRARVDAQAAVTHRLQDELESANARADALSHDIEQTREASARASAESHQQVLRLEFTRESLERQIETLSELLRASREMSERVTSELAGLQVDTVIAEEINGGLRSELAEEIAQYDQLAGAYEALENRFMAQGRESVSLAINEIRDIQELTQAIQSGRLWHVKKFTAGARQWIKNLREGVSSWL